MRPPIERRGGDPFDRVHRLDAIDRSSAMSLAIAAALLAHVAIGGALSVRADEPTDTRSLGAQELSIEREVPPPEPPPEPEMPAPPVPEPRRSDPSVRAAAPCPAEDPGEAASSEAAQAGEVLAQESDEQDDEDEEDEEDENTFVEGDGGAYAGGMTASGGASLAVVRGSIVDDGGVPGGTGTLAMAPPPPPASKDLSRGAWVDGSTSWDDCDFPGEADRDRIRDAIVGMTVTVRPDGTAQSVQIVRDPGHGFARTATACALHHKFVPALDAAGHRIWGTTAPFTVGFHR